MNEEIRLKMGLDSSAVAVGLRGIKGQVQTWAGQISSTMKSAFAGIGLGIGIGVLTAQFKKTLDVVEKLKLSSGALGVSTDFLQDINNIAVASGIATEKVEKLLSVFIKGLPAGADVEKSFFAIIDKLAAIESPAERAQFAMKKFGKSGLELIKIAGDGSAALKEMAKGFQKFSDFDIRQLEQADAAMDKATNSISISVGKVLSHFTLLVKAFAKLTVDGNKKGSFGEAMIEKMAEITRAEAKAAEESKKRQDAAQAAFEKAEGAEKKHAKTKAELKAIEKDRAETEKIIAELQKDEFERALKRLPIEKQITTLMRDRALLMGIVNAPGVSDVNRARALAGFASVHHQIQDLQGQLPPPASDDRTALQKWNQANMDKATSWRESHVDVHGNIGGVPWNKQVPVVKPAMTGQNTALQVQEIVRLLNGQGTIKIKGEDE